MEFYTAVVLITAGMLAVTVIDINSNRIINRTMKRNRILTCHLIALAMIFEWAGIRLNGAPQSFILLHKFVKLAEFCIAPMIGVSAVASYGKLKYKKSILSAVTLNIIFEIIAVNFKWVINIDSSNIYHRGPLYPIYIAIYSLSIIYCVVSIWNIRMRHYKRGSNVLIATLVFLIIGIAIQQINSNIRVDYICVAISNYFLYNYRNKMILMTDGLTHLLNRRCYEKDIEKLDPPALIFLADVNDFKILNDTYGHTVGDYYLKEIAAVIQKVFGKESICYRYGGDEFCIIIKNELNSAKEKVSKFNAEIEKRQKTDSRFPGVAIGYAKYIDKEVHVTRVIKNADDMMYRTKNVLKQQAKA